METIINVWLDYETGNSFFVTQPLDVKYYKYIDYTYHTISSWWEPQNFQVQKYKSKIMYNVEKIYFKWIIRKTF